MQNISNEAESHKRIAKNTLMLYVRMLLSMIITLYTSRVVLDVLGVVDFGIYNVVGGIIIALGFLNNAMAASTQRFLTFEIGKNDRESLISVFRMSVTIHLLISFLVLILAETLGLWFLNNKLNIPETRIFAANWVYQFSVFSFIIMVLSVPYNALIIAHEKMKTFALIGIFEVFLKLGSVFLLVLFLFDKLILYAVLLFLISAIIRIIYGIYCFRNFDESKNYKLQWDKSLFKSMGSFAGWNLLGVSAGIAYNQGINILLNIFFGPVVNAARGIAFQVQSAVSSFVTNFQVAVNPTIIKLYAKGDVQQSKKLVCSSSKFSYYLLFILCMPILLNANSILELWLKEVPEFTVNFTKLVLIDILIGSISLSLQSIVNATGNIRKYQLIVSSILLLNLPTSFIFLKLGFAPEYTMIISILFSTLALFVRLIIIKNLIEFPIMIFLTSVIFPIILVSIVTAIFSIYLTAYLPNSNLKIIYSGTISSVTIIISILLFGINKSEKIILSKYTSKILNRLKK